MCLRAYLLSLAIVASQVRHYVKPQDSSFMDYQPLWLQLSSHWDIKPLLRENLKLNEP